jgi:hypothetical protein
LQSSKAGIAQLVEHDLAKVGVASSSLVSRSKNLSKRGFFMKRILPDQGSENIKILPAQVVELVDTQDLKSCGHCGRSGSTPLPGTKGFSKMLKPFFIAGTGMGTGNPNSSLLFKLF